MSPESPQRGAIFVVAAVVEQGGRYLITRRRETAVLPLLWEFPGGKVEPGETDQQALKREMRHRLGVNLEVYEMINNVRHDYEHYCVELHLYSCKVVSGEPAPLNVHEFRWVKSDEFDGIEFTPADERSMSLLLGLN